MSSDVDICNLSLAHLGEDATVTNIDPPEGSAQAEYCQTFYPMARDAVLEMHTWNFATTRINGAAVTSPASSWQYAYALPTDCLKVISVLPPGAQDDYTTPALPGGTITLADGSLMSSAMYYAMQQTQPFVLETASDGSVIILTNQSQAVIRYVKRVTDTTKFSPLAVLTISRLLASYLAGPIIKGDVGRKEAQGQYQFFVLEFGKAVGSDSSQRLVQPQHIVPWMNNR